MNISITSLDTVEVQADGTVTVYLMSVNDLRGKYFKGDVEVGQKVYTFCLDSTNNKPTSLGVYLITGITKFTTSKIKGVTLKRLNITTTDDNKPSVPAFICSSINYIDDIPNGDVIGITNELTESARTYNLLHQPKPYIDTITVANIVTDLTVTDKTKQHYISLQHTPTTEAVQMEINGVSYYENDDFMVDREKSIIYFDTTDDDFTFESLKDSATTVRVFYKYVEY